MAFNSNVIICDELEASDRPNVSNWSEMKNKSEPNFRSSSQSICLCQDTSPRLSRRTLKHYFISQWVPYILLYQSKTLHSRQGFSLFLGLFDSAKRSWVCGRQVGKTQNTAVETSQTDWGAGRNMTWTPVTYARFRRKPSQESITVSAVSVSGLSHGIGPSVGVEQSWSPERVHSLSWNVIIAKSHGTIISYWCYFLSLPFYLA